MTDDGLVGPDEIAEARERVMGFLHRTPMLRCTSLAEMLGVDLLLKAELFQKTGSFKPRGIVNRILTLAPGERERGLVSLSAGNAAAAVAFGAAIAGCRATICMPATAVSAKVEATRGYGGDVELCEGDLLEGFARVRDERGLTVVHPFADRAVIAGHGSLGLEILEDAGDADVVILPVGGGGLISGVAAAVKAHAPQVRVVGVEPETSDVMRRSLEAGEALTIGRTMTVADGLAAPMTGEINLSHVRKYVDEMVVVPDEAILEAMGLIAQRAKVVAESAAAAPVAALRSGAVKLPRGTRVVVVLSGGNANPSQLAGGPFP